MAKKTNQHYYTTDDYTALEAITEAQKIAFAPIIFQNALMLRNSGILKCLEDAGNKGCSVEEISQQIDLSPYAIQLLIDVGLSSHIIYQPKERYVISKTGLFLLNDKMTQINMNFVQDVCYQGMFHLEEALQKQKPAGLKVFSDTPSIYPILHQLPEKTKQSWFAFDHFYSDNAFKQAFNYIKQAKPHHIYDLGGNTGRWANYCLTNDQELQITILDLPEQVDILQELFKNTPVADRIQTIALDILKTNELPQEADIWWMSQFLDCFTPEQIIHILTLIRKNLPKHAKIFILECFWDKQPFEAGALSLNSSSLYFSVMANGNSRFYHSRHFQQYLQQAGFVIEQEIDNIGICHTLLICKPDPSLV